MTKARWASFAFLIFLSFLLQELNAVPCIVLADLARAKSGADRWSHRRLLGQVIPPAVNSWLFDSSACCWGWPIAPDLAIMPRWDRLLPALAQCIRPPTGFRNRPRSSP